MLLLFYDVMFGSTDGNEPIILLDLLNIFHYIDVIDGNVTLEKAMVGDLGKSL